jgi:hypothetical protein
MLVCFCDHNGVVHCEFIAQGQTESTGLFESADKLMGICSEDKTQSLACSAPVHKVVRVRDFLTKKYIKKIYHLPYSSDLAP